MRSDLDKRAGRRTRTVALAALAALGFSSPIVTWAAPADPIVVLTERERREVTPVVRGAAELVPLGPLLPSLGITSSADSRGGTLTLTYQGREVVLYDRKSLASVGGDLRLLSSPIQADEGRWLVPLDSLPRLLSPLLGKRVDWRPASRLLLVGDVPAPRIVVRTYPSGDLVRVVLESSEPVPFRVGQEEKRVTVAIPRDFVDVSHLPERLTGGIVESVQFLGGRENVFAIALGRRFHELKTAEEAGPPARLVLEFQAQAPVAGAAAPGAAPTPPPRPAPVEAHGLRTVVIDPGHGGLEVGAKGPGGTLEKDVTLSLARRLRTALANSLGLQVFLTRDRDVEIALDERTSFANNYKADLFISIHANASRSQGAKGSEVYFLAYQTSDEDSRRVAALEGSALPPAGSTGGSDLALILWDMAQAEHLEESSALATRIQEELTTVTGSGTRGIKQAPFRVLVGAAMPAVLVEVAFISNAEEEKLLVSEAYQGKVVSALVKGVARYQQQREQRAAGLSASPAGP
jgi:N-acetylmuramoyl-L-alanine amidase